MVGKSNEEKKQKKNLKKIIRDKKQWLYKDIKYIFITCLLKHIFQNSLFFNLLLLSVTFLYHQKTNCILMFYNVSDGV